MGFEILVKKFEDRTRDILERIEVNQIVCFSSKLEDEKLNKEDVDAYLNASSYNKIEVNSVICISDMSKFEYPSQENENIDLKNEVEEYLIFLNEEINMLCSSGEHKYKMNELFKEKLKMIEGMVKQMNYFDWLLRKDPSNNPDIVFLSIAKKRYSFPKIYLDIETRRHSTVDVQFNYRRNLLEEIRVGLAATFSTHLFIPNFEGIPTIEYKNCTPTNICELILALTDSGYFKNQEEMKIFLLEMFQIDPKFYIKATYDIRTRPKGRNQFVVKLSDGFK